MQILTVFICCLLVLSACAPAARPPVEPTTVPVQSTSAPEGKPLPSPEASAQATLESSLLATEWRGYSDGNVLFPLDPASGTALPEYTPISLGQGFSHAFSPDGHLLAVVSFPNQDYHNGSLLLIDLRAWKTKTFELGLNGWVNRMVFSPDASQLAIAYGQSRQTLSLVNSATGEMTARHETGSSLVSGLKFTKDGTGLMSYSLQVENRFTENEMSAGPPQIQLFDASDLSILWTAEAGEIRDGIFPRDEKSLPKNVHEPGQAYYLNPGLVFAPDRDALYIVHADAEKLTTVDFEQQAVVTVDIQTKLTWLEKLLTLTAGTARAKIGDGISRQAAISADGQTLYVVGMNSVTHQDKQGNWQMEQTPLGLELIQTRDGSRLEHFESNATELSLSPDGRFLFLRSWGEGAPWTQVFDTLNRQFGSRAAWTFASPVLRMNGEYLLVSTFSTGEYTHHMSILEPDGLNELTAWTDSTSLGWLPP